MKEFATLVRLFAYSLHESQRLLVQQFKCETFHSHYDLPDNNLLAPLITDWKCSGTDWTSIPVTAKISCGQPGRQAPPPVRKMPFSMISTRTVLYRGNSY